jgi:integrase
MIAFIFQPSRHGERSRLWSARIRLDEWPKARTFPLHVTDKRVADQKLRDLISELERESHGVGISRPVRESLRMPLLEHHANFLAANKAANLAELTQRKYRQYLPKLFQRCGWVTIRDVSGTTFTRWREKSGLAPKSVNDLLGLMRTFLLWMKREHLILADPLAEVRKVTNPGVGSFRRALAVEEIRKLLETAPPRRALVYLTLVYTGLRRRELDGIKWGDFEFGASPPWLKVPSSLSKNRKESTHYLRPELAAALRAARPDDVKPERYVFKGRIPKVSTFRKDLAAAGIPFEDSRGRRIDIHALRKTYGTLLAASGVAPRVAMELMRHSDMKLTMGVYTDTAQLPILEGTARLPSFELPLGREQGRVVSKPNNLDSCIPDSQLNAQGDAQTGVSAVPQVTSLVTPGQTTESRNLSEDGILGHKKAPSVSTRRSLKMVGTERFELSTSCSRSKRSTRLSYVPFSIPAWAEMSGQETAKAGGIANKIFRIEHFMRTTGGAPCPQGAKGGSQAKKSALRATRSTPIKPLRARPARLAHRPSAPGSSSSRDAPARRNRCGAGRRSRAPRHVRRAGRAAGRGRRRGSCCS